MAWQVAGLREKHYRVETPDEVSAWVTDEIDTMSRGWVPLTSARETDGSLRVTYGRLSPELDDSEDAYPCADLVVHRPPTDAAWGLAMLFALLAIATTVALFAKP